MLIYEVGGAVRDSLLGLPVEERDWVVVGATPAELRALGLRQVGKDFPVFIHPHTGEQYALARRERKIGPGYEGFEFDTDTSVTLEQDLSRRDLTINAIARDRDGNIIDPYGGRADIENRVLRHVSPAFSEDPLRVLRVARFAARFHSLGFRVAAETVRLMAEIVQAGEIEALRPERVWLETDKALATAAPQVYFEVLRECGALARAFPEIDALFGVPQPKEWHPEVDCGVHTLMVLDQATALSPEVDVRFAALTHDLGKATTPASKLPSHPNHEKRSMRLIGAMAERLPIPTAVRELALIVAEFHGHVHRAFELRASTILKVLERTDAFRRPERFEKFLLACEADARGRAGLEDRPYPQADYLRGARQAAARVSGRELAREGLDGPQIGEALKRKRLQAITAYKADVATKRA